ncbi:MAG: hypothetical protein JKY65_18875 [Planctomycetes bacterium]|nr:hypothetical protein [Planctomycetota bacterium]
MSFLLRLLLLIAFVALAVFARLNGATEFAEPRALLGGTRAEIGLAWAGAGLGPWFMGCAVAHVFARLSGARLEKPLERARHHLIAGLSAVGVVGVTSVFFAQGVAAGLHLQGVQSWPSTGAVFTAQLCGCLSLVLLAVVVTRLQLGDGFVILFCADLGALVWFEAGTGAQRLVAGLLLVVVLTPIWLKALAVRFEFDLHLGGETQHERYPIPGVMQPYLQSLWLSAFPIVLAGHLAPSLVATPLAVEVIWLVAFCLACPFNVYFFMSLNHTPVSVVCGERRYGDHEEKRGGREAFERDLSRWTLPLAISLTVGIAGPVALGLVGFSCGAVGVLAILLAAVLWDLLAAWRARGLVEPTPAVHAAFLLEAFRARDLLEQAGIPAHVPGATGWILFWDYSPRSWANPVLVAKADEARAREVLEAFVAVWGHLDLDAPARQRAAEAIARGEQPEF